MDAFPFSECDRLDTEWMTMSGAFGEVFYPAYDPIYRPLHFGTVPVDSAVHKAVFYRLRNRLIYMDDADVTFACHKKVDLVSVFVLVEFFKDMKSVRWTRLSTHEDDVAWRKLYRVARNRLAYFIANVDKIQQQSCSCLCTEDYTCATFVYPEYEGALRAIQRTSSGPFGWEWEVFLHVRRLVGNDLALKIIDYV
jgi:hypothetical protein